MIQGKSEILNWEYIGALLASLSDQEQVPFFRGFTKEVLHYPTHFARESQMLSIQSKLTEPEREIIRTIGWDGKDD